jgi:hypothetical protein
MAKTPNPPGNDIERLKLQVEIWKKVVQTQEHFNDLGLRIRNFAILLVAAFLGISGYALKEGILIPFFGLKLSLSGLIVLASLLPWKAFYLMDKFWYHRLLKGSVNAGIPIEKDLANNGLIAGLGENISRESQIAPIKKWWLFEWSNKPLRSDDRMDAFYALVTRGILLLSAVLILFGLFPGGQTNVSTSEQPSTTVVYQEPASVLPPPTEGVLPGNAVSTVPANEVANLSSGQR